MDHSTSLLNVSMSKHEIYVVKNILPSGLVYFKIVQSMNFLGHLEQVVDKVGIASVRDSGVFLFLLLLLLLPLLKILEEIHN